MSEAERSSTTPHKWPYPSGRRRRELTFLAGRSWLGSPEVMDVDFWSSRIHSVKHLSAVQASRHNSDRQLEMDDSDGDDDKKACFPCPFCYVDIDIHLLCSHLEDEHCFDLKNAVCPLCAANLGKDVTAHFVVQHTSSLKRKKRTLWVGSSAMLGKELSLFLGSSTNGRENTAQSASDLLLSPFLSSVSISDHDGSQQDESSNKNASITSHAISTEISSLDGSDELDYEEKRQRSAFAQQLIASMIL